MAIVRTIILNKSKPQIACLQVIVRLGDIAANFVSEWPVGGEWTVKTFFSLRGGRRNETMAYVVKKVNNSV